MEYKEKIRNMLEALPDKILLKEKEIIEKEEAADKIELETKSIDLSYERQIATEIDDEGKKKFKNEMERKTELEKRLRLNTLYQDKISRISELRKEIKQEGIMLSYLKRRHRSAIGLSRLEE